MVLGLLPKLLADGLGLRMVGVGSLDAWSLLRWRIAAYYRRSVMVSSGGIVET